MFFFYILHQEVIIANGWNTKCVVFIGILCGVLNIFNISVHAFERKFSRQQNGKYILKFIETMAYKQFN